MKMPALKSGYLYLLLFVKDDIANQIFLLFIFTIALKIWEWKYENASRNVSLVIFNFIYKTW